VNRFIIIIFFDFLKKEEMRSGTHFSQQTCFFQGSTFFSSWERSCISLALSFPGGQLGSDLAVAIHISPNNGPIEMIPSGKLIYFVPPIHFACSIM
jgi:hypothetical protein